MKGISAFIKDPREVSCLFYQVRMAVCEPGSGLSLDIYRYLDLGFTRLQNCDKLISIVNKLSGLWYFVIAAHGVKDIPRTSISHFSNLFFTYTFRDLVISSVSSFINSSNKNVLSA